ncbi:MAG: ABC transporter permease [Ignavibacteria bacterium]|nr:ABC transporter permease [Ignavibacteria bacterium]
MKRFIGFVKKEFKHILRDYRTLLILFGMPVVQILLFGFAIKNEIKDSKIAILDRSKDYITEEITNKLLSSGYFLLYENLKSEDYIESEFRKGIVKEVIVFEEDFAKNLFGEGKSGIQIIADASDPNYANMLINYTSSIINDYLNTLHTGHNIQILINPEVKMIYNPEIKSVYMFIPGLMAVILLLVSSLMTSISITREKEFGTMEVLLVSPLKPLQIISGKVIPYVFIAFIDALIIIFMAKYVFAMPIEGSIILLILESVLFITTALTLGILISTISSSQQIAMMSALGGLMLPTILLSGYIFPIENMPYVLQLLSNLIPAKWFVIIVKAIMLKGLGFSYIWFETAVLVITNIVLFVISIARFKIRLE